MNARQPLPVDVLARLTEPRGELIYTNYGRVVHSFWMIPGTYTTDDFGFSVPLDKEDRAMLTYHLRQSH